MPGGRIQEFILFRRTLSEPLSENFTMTSYVKIHSGVLPRSFDDKGLGIFSEQQYKVSCDVMRLGLKFEGRIKMIL